MSLFYKKTDNYHDGDPKVANIVFTAVGLLLTLLAFWLWVGPTYRVWSAGMTGQAELAQAEQNRQIRVKEAQALKDSAALQAEAEVIRAEGTSKANAIVANGLGGPEGYLRYLYIDMLREQQEKQIIYLPTEAGLPILEAGKR